MMTPCKGIHRIVCTMAGGCPRKLKNIQPDCISCPEAVTQILDLERNVLYEHRISLRLGLAGRTDDSGEVATKAKSNKKTVIPAKQTVIPAKAGIQKTRIK